MNYLLIFELSSQYLKDKDCLKLLLLNKEIRYKIRMFPTL